MPEFLTEKNWHNDFVNNKKWIFGIYENCPSDIEIEFKNRITNLINNAFNDKKINYNDIIFSKNKEAELTKIIKNTFLSTKVSYFNEIYDFATKLDVDYNKVIELVETDERIGNTYMNCPGHDNKKGYGGTCFPKDTNSIYYQMISNNINSYILEGNLYRNETIDRPERDWLSDKGRTNMNQYQTKIILVTGGAGFLGRHLCKNY